MFPSLNTALLELKTRWGKLIQEYVDAGAYKFVVRPLCAGEESMEQLEIMGQEILPLFHR